MTDRRSASEISAMLAGRIEDLCRHLLPAGKREGNEWRVGDVNGNPGQSLAVHLSGEKAGLWADFAGDRRGDALDLVQNVLGIDAPEAVAWACDWLGVDRSGHRCRRDRTIASSNGNQEPHGATLPPKAHPQLGEPTLQHEYTDADGRLIFIHCRFDQDGGKTFRPLSWRDGRWVWKDPEGALPLYNLADLAARPDAPVLLVEGEKTSEIAREIVESHVITTWPHGAKAVGKVDWSPLEGRDVTAWPDADDEGRKAMKAAAEAIAQVGATRIGTVRLPTGLPKGWDLADQLPEGWDEDTVSEMIAGADLVAVSSRARPDISRADASRWVGQVPDPLVFTVADLIPESMVTLLVADGGAGKSMLAQMAITSIAAGHRFLGYDTRAGAAAGLFAEDPENVLHIRQERINRTLGIDMADLAGRCFPESYAGFDAVLWRDFKVTKFFDQIEEQLARIPDLRFLAIDNAALVFAGAESDRVEVTQFIGRITGLAIRRKIGILLSAHTSKSSDDSSVAKAGSGSTAWLWACRSVLKLTASKDEDKSTLTLIKANHTKPGAAIDLHWKDAVLFRKPEPGSLEHSIRQRALDNAIFAAVAKAWPGNNPLSSSPQARNRYLPSMLARRTTDFRRDEIERAMLGWIDSGHLTVDRQSARLPLGLRVEKYPNNVEQPSNDDVTQHA